LAISRHRLRHLAWHTSKISSKKKGLYEILIFFSFMPLA
jgi:hypothetical protein